MYPIGIMSHHLVSDPIGSHLRTSCFSFFCIPAINGWALARWANEKQRWGKWAELASPLLFRSYPPNRGEGGARGVMDNRQSTPSARCNLIRGRGRQPITTIASLCARRLLPAGAEREAEWEKRGQNREKARDEWMQCSGANKWEEGSKGETETIWLCKS